MNVDSWNNKNAFTTSRYWLEKLFLILDEYQDKIIVSGRVWLDETYYLIIPQDFLKSLCLIWLSICCFIQCFPKTWKLVFILQRAEIILSDLVPGSYMVAENADSRYKGQAPQTVTVEADKTATVTFKNTLRKGNLKIIKTSEDGIVSDILFVIKGEDYRKTAKSKLLRLCTGQHIVYFLSEKVDFRVYWVVDKNKFK